jgi:hypothetical protein
MLAERLSRTLLRGVTTTTSLQYWPAVLSSETSLLQPPVLSGLLSSETSLLQPPVLSGFLPSETSLERVGGGRRK